MKYRGIKALLVLLCLFYGRFGLAQTKYNIPSYIGHINDFAGVLQSQEIQQLEKFLLSYEDSTSTQIAVVIEKKLNGKEANDRAIEFARGWGVGSKEKNNGVLLYLAIEDRKYFTQTSQATQGKLTDGVVGEIQRDYLVPNLKKGDYFSAISQTLVAYTQALQGEFVAGKKQSNSTGNGFFIVVVVLIIIIILINNNRNGRGFKRGGVYWFPTGGWNGGGSGGGGGDWGGFGGGGGFDGGGAGGSW